MKKASWDEYHNSSIMEGCIAFVTKDIHGYHGIVELNTLSLETIIVLDDRKGTGKVSATVKGILGENVPYTVVILGMEGDKEIVFTFHPGDPIVPSTISSEGLHGKQITAKEAMEMEFSTAKII